MTGEIDPQTAEQEHLRKRYEELNTPESFERLVQELKAASGMTNEEAAAAHYERRTQKILAEYKEFFGRPAATIDELNTAMQNESFRAVVDKLD